MTDGERPQGPWDAADPGVPDAERVDLGALRVPVTPDLHLQVEAADEGLVAATLSLPDGGTCRLQAFAAGTGGGRWAEAAASLAAGLTADGAEVTWAEGPTGPELHALVPETPRRFRRRAATAYRFTGHDGPTWLLRATYTGEAATPGTPAAHTLTTLTRDTVVSAPTPHLPGTPLLLTLPT